MSSSVRPLTSTSTESAESLSFISPSPSLSSGSIKTASTGKSTLSSHGSSSSAITGSRTHKVTIADTPEVNKLRRRLADNKAAIDKIKKANKDFTKMNAEWDFKLANHKRGSTLFKVGILTFAVLLAAGGAPVVAFGAFVAIPLIIAGDTCRYANETAPKKATSDPTITLKAK